MDIMLTASGTRGDVQPALALALGLREAGHRVRMLAGSNFKGWIEAHGLECIPMLDMEALMRSPGGIEWVEKGSDNLAQLRIMRRLVNDNADALTRPLLDHGRECDLHVSSFTSTSFVEVLAEKHGIRHIASALQPYRSTRSGAATLVPITRRDSFLNKLFGMLGDRLSWTVVRDVTNAIRQREGLATLRTGEWIRRAAQIPLVNGYSPHVVSHPTDWTPDSATVGYWFLDDGDDWTPPPALVEFLNEAPKPVYVGFGSMSSADPKAIFDMTCKAAASAGQRVVYGTGWSGLADVRVPENVCVIDKAPHAWLFERVSGVVHHGGAGTTAAGLRAGKPTFIVPHMADQPFWGRRVYRLGAGPRPIPRPKLTADALAGALRAIAADADMRRNAGALGAKIRAENGVARGVEAIERFAKKGMNHA